MSCGTAHQCGNDIGLFAASDSGDADLVCGRSVHGTREGRRGNIPPHTRNKNPSGGVIATRSQSRLWLGSSVAADVQVMDFSDTANTLKSDVRIAKRPGADIVKPGMSPWAWTAEGEWCSGVELAQFECALQPWIMPWSCTTARRLGITRSFDAGSVRPASYRGSKDTTHRTCFGGEDGKPSNRVT